MATEITKSQGQVHDELDALPSYAHVREQQQQQSTPAQGPNGSGEHRRSLETAKGKKWLTLFVKSRANSSSLPVFLEGDIVTGRVELDLDKAESSKGVTVTVSLSLPLLCATQPGYLGFTIPMSRTCPNGR